MGEWDRDRQPDERGAGKRGQHARHVAGGEGVRPDVADVHRAVGETDRPERHGAERPQTGTQRREGGDRCEAGDQRYECRERVLAEADAGLAMQHGVVDRVHQQDADGGAERERLE
jgi:hypothetical protein